MAVGRVIVKRIPVCPGRDSRYTIRRNQDEDGSPWWVHYERSAKNFVPADAAHSDLVDLVNRIKDQISGGEGGAFSINEHGQVIARMSTPRGMSGQSVHAIAVRSGRVLTYTQPLVFDGGALDPRSQPAHGADWPGPLCGMTYSFAAPGSPKPHSDNFEQVFMKVAGHPVVLSVDAGIANYPPATGALATFLTALRQLLPNGGRFRVNEHGRAFTANGSLYIGTIPLRQWFRPLTATS